MKLPAVLLESLIASPGRRYLVRWQECCFLTTLIRLALSGLGCRWGLLERVEQFEKTLADFTQQVALTGLAIGGKTIRHGRGAPTKDVPRAGASHCLLVYQQYVGVPRHPSWNDYTSESLI